MKKVIFSIIALMILPLFSQTASAAALSKGETVAVVVGVQGAILAAALIAEGNDDSNGNSNTNTSTTTTTTAR